MAKENPDEAQDPKAGRRRLPKNSRRNLESFLASICEAGGMTGRLPGTPDAAKTSPHPRNGLACQGPCGKADWRSHLDIPVGILCVSAAWSRNPEAEKHRDVTLAITYRDHIGKVQYNEMVFCDSEIRWLMETIWHAPIWE